MSSRREISDLLHFTNAERLIAKMQRFGVGNCCGMLVRGLQFYKLVLLLSLIYIESSRALNYLLEAGKVQFIHLSR